MLSNAKFLKTFIVLISLFIFLLIGVKLGPRFGIWIFPPTPNQYVKDALDKMENGIYATGSEWKKIKLETKNKSKNLNNYSESHDLLRKALLIAGGKHSHLVTKEMQTSYNLNQKMPSIEIDDLGILKIKLTEIVLGRVKEQEYSSQVIDLIKKNRNKIKGLILDLRDNTGGYIKPMIAAISPFLPDGDVLYFNIKNKNFVVKISHGKIYVSGDTIRVDDIKLLNIPIAILQNKSTGSSAEGVLLAFRGLNNVKTFGEPSSGYCSCNQTYYLYDGTIMNLTIGTFVTRTNEEFCENPIEPNEKTDDPENESVNWIKSCIK